MGRGGDDETNAVSIYRDEVVQSSTTRRHRLVVRTQDSHSCNRGSIPLGAASDKTNAPEGGSCFVTLWYTIGELNPGSPF